MAKGPFVSGAAVRRQAKHWIGELRIKTPGPQALLRQLSGMAVNINQIAKVANARGFVRMGDIDRIKAMQGLLWRTMKRL